MKDLKTLNETKNEIQKEVKEKKKERLLYTFLNILKPSYPGNPAAAAQLFGYLGIIVGGISLATGAYIGNLPATLAIFGFSAIGTTALTVGAYVSYEHKEYLTKKIKKLNEIDYEINNFDNAIGNSKSKANVDVKSSSKNNITEESKSISDRISELKEYKESIIGNTKVQNELQKNNQKSKKR